MSAFGTSPGAGIPHPALEYDFFEHVRYVPEADVAVCGAFGAVCRQQLRRHLRYGYFRCLAAVALASAVFVCRVFTRRFAPLIGIARGSSTPDWLRGVRITAFPLRINLDGHASYDGRLLLFVLLGESNSALTN